MCDEPADDGQNLLLQALKHLTLAIHCLDRGNAPEHIAAHVDLAIHQLREVIGNDAPAMPIAQMAKNADPHWSTN